MSYNKVKFKNGLPWYAKDQNDLQDYLWDQFHNALAALHENVRLSDDGCEVVGSNVVVNGQYCVGGYITEDYTNETIAISSPMNTRYVYFRIHWEDVDFNDDPAIAISYDGHLIETSERKQFVIEVLEGSSVPSDTSEYEYHELCRVNLINGLYRQIPLQGNPVTMSIIAHRTTESDGYASINGIEGGQIVVPRNMCIVSLTTHCDGETKQTLPTFNQYSAYNYATEDVLTIYCDYTTDHCQCQKKWLT